MRTLDSVQMLRAVAALLVLLYHLVNTAAFGWIEPNGALRQPGALFDAVGFSGVDLFFVISGVVMVVTCRPRLGQPREAASFLKRRIARIYPLYWIATVAVLALCWLRPELATRDKFSWPTIVNSLLLWPQARYPIVAVGWTLSYEMFFYLVFSGLIMLPRRAFLPALGLWAAATFALFPIYDQPPFRLSIEAQLNLPLFASPLALEFIAGCVIGWIASSKTMPLAGAALAAGVMALAFIGGYVGATRPLDAKYGLVRAALFGGAWCLVTYGAVGLECRGKLVLPRWIVFWGDASYSTYLTHMYALWLVAAAWPQASSAAASQWPTTIAGLTTCGVIAAMCHVWVERPLNHRFQQLPGADAQRRRGAQRVA